MLILDFTSQLSGEGAYDQELQDGVVAAGHTEDIFHLKVPYDQRCHLAGLFGVTQAP